MGLLREKRKNEHGLKALAAGSLAIARAHAVLDQTEKQLEHEIARDNRKPPSTNIGKFRFHGQKVMHTKQVLLCIVLLNIIDCILVLGELILDIYYLKGVLETEQAAATLFVVDMKSHYPTELAFIRDSDIIKLRDMIINAHIDFKDKRKEDDPVDTTTPMFISSTYVTDGNVSNQTSKNRRRRSTSGDYDMTNTNSSDVEHHYGDLHEHAHSLEEKIAHIFHYCSVSILAILVVETFLKLFCSGKEFFERHLEVFDGVIVFISFIVDLVFIKGLSVYEIQDYVVILAFLVPWRVIRVVNSLVVAVIDHEHFRMKLLYKQKKTVCNDLKTAKADNKSLQTCVEALKNIALKGGVSDKVVSGTIAMYESKKGGKKSVGAFASTLMGPKDTSSSIFGKPNQVIHHEREGNGALTSDHLNGTKH